MICPIRRKPPNRLQPFLRFGTGRARASGTDGGEALAEAVTPPARSAEILTARLRLVPLKPADLDDLARMYADPEVMVGSSGVGSVRSREDSAEWLRHTLVTPTAPFHRTFRVEDRGDGGFLGRCGLRPESEAPETEL